VIAVGKIILVTEHNTFINGEITPGGSRGFMLCQEIGEKKYNAKQYQYSSEYYFSHKAKPFSQM